MSDEVTEMTGPNNCRNPECPWDHHDAQATHCCSMACVGMITERVAATADPWCPACKEYMLSGRVHRCPPLWYCHDPAVSDLVFPEDVDDSYSVYAVDPADAAAKYCENVDSSWDYIYILGGGCDCVAVFDPRTKIVHKVAVSAESVATYRGTLL